MLHIVLNKSWKQHKLYGHLPLISQTNQDEQDMLVTAGEA